MIEKKEEDLQFGINTNNFLQNYEKGMVVFDVILSLTTVDISVRRKLGFKDDEFCHLSNFVHKESLKKIFDKIGQCLKKQCFKHKSPCMDEKRLDEIGLILAIDKFGNVEEMYCKYFVEFDDCNLTKVIFHLYWINE